MFGPDPTHVRTRTKARTRCTQPPQLPGEKRLILILVCFKIRATFTNEYHWSRTHILLCAVINHSFQAASRSSGTACMIALNTLKESSQFLLNNSCIFGIKFIKVATVKASTTLETLFVQKTSIFNESGVHTWEIEDFFALQSPCYSPEFEVGGYTW